MAKADPKTIEELLYWSYSCLAMAHSAVEKNQEKYLRVNYVIRARLYKGLMDGSMNIGTIFQDEKIKIIAGSTCSYCGAPGPLALDHLVPRSAGGQDSGDNLILACKPCNSSKGRRDLLEWMHTKGKFPPLLLLRRFLKLAIDWSLEHNIMNIKLQDVNGLDLPFKPEFIPIRYPPPSDLRLVSK